MIHPQSAVHLTDKCERQIHSETVTHAAIERVPMNSSFALWMFYNFVIFDGLDFVPVYNFQIVDYMCMYACICVHYQACEYG